MNTSAMKALILLAAVASTLAAAAQSSGPSSTGFSEGNWNAGTFEQATTGRVVLFPNPASNEVSIAFPGFTGTAVVSIVGSDGRLMRRDQVNQTAGQRLITEVSDLPDGIYLVNVEQEGDRVTERLIVAH